jgi:hypothetical protein
VVWPNRVLSWLQEKIGEILSIVVCDHNVTRVHSHDLMGQEISSLVISVIGYHKALDWHLVFVGLQMVIINDL